MSDPKDFAGGLEEYPGQQEYEAKAAERDDAEEDQ